MSKVVKEGNKMSRRFSLQILLPIEGYEEDKAYKSDDISLKVANLDQEPDDVYYRRLKEKSVYASFGDREIEYPILDTVGGTA